MKMRWTARVNVAPSEVTVRQMTEDELAVARSISKSRSARLGGGVSVETYTAEREALAATMAAPMTHARWLAVAA